MALMHLNLPPPLAGHGEVRSESCYRRLTKHIGLLLRLANLQVSMFPGAVPMMEVERNLDKYKDLELIPYWYRIIPISFPSFGCNFIDVASSSFPIYMYVCVRERETH
jgi:hypothetical protein